MKRRVRSPFLYAAVIGTGLVAGSAFAIVSSTQAAKQVSFENMDFSDMVSALSKETSISEETLSESLETNELIVSVSDIEKLEKDDSIAKYHETLADHYIVEYKTAEDAAKAYKKYNDSSEDSALLNRKVKKMRADFFCGSEEEPIDCQAWGAATMQLNKYADSLEGSSKKVTIAVIDSGINKDLFLFSENSKYDRLDLNSPLVYDYADKDNDVTDAGGHGTMVSATIAQSTPSNVKIIPIKVFTDNGEDDNFSDTLDALNAIKGKVDIVNLSLGIIEDDDHKLTASEINYVNKAMQEVKDAGTIIVAAAGNEANSAISYPAASPATIAVTSVDSNNNFSSSFSNYGAGVDFAAPGEELILPEADDSWYAMDGTSFSCPFVASAIANILTEHNDWTYDQVYNYLKLNAEDLGEAGRDQYYGWGSVSFHVNKYADLKISNINTPTEWTNQDVIVDIAASSDEYEIVKKSFGIGTITETPTSWTNTNSGSISQTINKNGTYTIWFKNSNNETASKTFTINKIDKDAPSITTALRASNISESGATLSIAVNDSASGLAKIIWYYKTSDDSEYTQIVDDYTSGVQASATTKTHALTDLTAGASYTAYAEVYDVAGNKITSGTITFDATDNNTGGNEGGNTGDEGGNTGNEGGNTGDNQGDGNGSGNSNDGNGDNGDPKDLPTGSNVQNPKTGGNNIILISVAGGTFMLAGAAVAIRRRR